MPENASSPPKGLSELTLRGYKTIKELEEFRPGRLNLLIGPNGAGKSNFISFFRFLSWALTPPGQLQLHVAQSGGASDLLFDGPETTREIEAEMTFLTEQGRNDYGFRLIYASDDTLIFAEERYRFSRAGSKTLAGWQELEPGHREAQLLARAESGDRTARTIHSLLRKFVVHQFHNTSYTARSRNKWDADDGRWLREDAANLASFLYRLYDEEPRHYRRIVETLRVILPFFTDFELEPDPYGKLLLRWREQGSDVVFSASQAADGMLRTMALVALLLQPEKDLPYVLLLDEPELGLHPLAISVVAGLIESASLHAQVFVATQSPMLLDHFDPEAVIVVERQERASCFRQLDAQALADWLEEYSLSELWEKNVLGGRPA